ncbi:hypothetical protein [Pontibacter sp. CAU 1760]
MKTLLHLCLLLAFVSCDSMEDVKPVFLNNDVCRMATFDVRNDGGGRFQEFLYDENRTLLGMETSFTDGGVYIKELFEFNSQNKISQRTYYVYDKLDSYTTYEYNATGLLTRVTTFGKEEGSISVTKKLQTKTYEYSSPKELRSVTITEPTATTEVWLYEYSNGLMHTARLYRPAGTLVESNSLEYDSRDRAFFEALPFINDVAFGESLGYPYYRNITKLTKTRPDGSVAKQNSYTSIFEYNLDGYTTLEARTRLDKSITDTFSYSYNCEK